MRFDDSFLNDLTARNDIADVVGSYVNLSKKSGSNLFGLCPFHNEKTPSFSVSTDKQIYHCFGCGKGGGVINFVMEIEGVSFPEAVEMLAKRAGMELPQQDVDDESRRRARLYQLNRDAARFFYERLVSSEGIKGQEYMERRKISASTATRFGLGYAPDSWYALLNEMHSKGYTDKELVDADLIRPGKKGGFYDTFRNRLMFPVIDIRGNVIGFSGRILGDGEPKYLNSKETAVFSKGNNLFGLNLAKKSKSGYIILVEGNIDVVSLHQAGFDSAVASLGTSLTPDQARLISRYTNKVIISYDNDGAGKKASQRAIDILGKLDIKVNILQMNGAKDPDEYIKANGADAFNNLILRSEDQQDFRLNEILKKFDLNDDAQKVTYLKEASRLIATFPSQLEREVYSMRAAENAGVKPDSILSEVSRIRKGMISGAKKSGEREEMRPTRSIQPAARDLRYNNPASAVAEEGIIRLIYLDPSLAQCCSLKQEDFSSEALGDIYSVLTRRAEAGAEINTSVLSSELDSEHISLLVNILSKPEDISSGAATMREYCSCVQKQKNTGKKEDLSSLAGKFKNSGKGYRS